jgi:nucleotidyltransferase/DNA polymerase involved in DNA repair
MGIDAELNGTNGASLGQAALVARSAKENPAVTRKVTVKLTEQLCKRLEAATDRPGVGKSMVVEAALERFLDPAPPIEGLIHEALARITNQLERLDGDVRTIAETVALHARYHLTVTPTMAQPQQREACAVGQERFVALAEQVDRRVRLGRSLMREAIGQVNGSRPDSSWIDNASLVSAHSDQEPPPATVPDATADLTAAVEEDGSNSNFRHLPNAFC